MKEGDIIKGGYLVIKGCLRSYYIIDGEEKTTAFYTETEPIATVTGADDSRADHFVSCVEMGETPQRIIKGSLALQVCW